MTDKPNWPFEPAYPATFTWATARVFGWTLDQYERWYAAHRALVKPPNPRCTCPPDDPAVNMVGVHDRDCDIHGDEAEAYVESLLASDPEAATARVLAEGVRRGVIVIEEPAPEPYPAVGVSGCFYCEQVSVVVVNGRAACGTHIEQVMSDMLGTVWRAIRDALYERGAEDGYGQAGR